MCHTEIEWWISLKFKIKSIKRIYREILRLPVSFSLRILRNKSSIVKIAFFNVLLLLFLRCRLRTFCNGVISIVFIHVRNKTCSKYYDFPDITYFLRIFFFNILIKCCIILILKYDWNYSTHFAIAFLTKSWRDDIGACFFCWER